MKTMLDTNICIYLIKKQPASALERFTDFPVGEIGISIVTLAELEYGASKSRHPSRNRAALDQFIAPLEVAEFDRQAAVVYGRLRATMETKGAVVGAMDLLIAAHAVSLGARLVTKMPESFIVSQACVWKIGCSGKSAGNFLPHRIPPSIETICRSGD